MACSDRVFRCFRSMEKAADRVTGAAGPFFVALAVILLSTSIATFFNVLQPDLPLPWLTTPICALIALDILANYYYVCTIPPGFVDTPVTQIENTFLWAPRRKAQAVRWSDEYGMTKAGVSQCRKCGIKRPERAHHCRICKRCVLKYDHHCPVCVTHQILILCLILNTVTYLVAGALCFSTLGLPKLWGAFDFHDTWPHAIPSVVYVLVFVLSAVLSIAVGVMLAWHLRSIMRGETSVESHDHDIYRKSAKVRGDTFINSYDVGARRNLALFFNIGPTGYPLWTLLLPLKTAPYSDGWAWVRRDGLSRHAGIRDGDEITDDEE